MENASKALIIAGAILLSILIISLGIMVYNNAKDSVGTNNLNKEQMQSFNSQWESYTGNNKTASDVRTLISAVISSNAAEKQAGSNRQVKMTYAANLFGSNAALSKKAPTTVPAVNASRTYTITAKYTDGVITLITIT